MSQISADSRGRLRGRLLAVCLVALLTAGVVGRAGTASDAAAPRASSAEPTATSASRSHEAEPPGDQRRTSSRGGQLHRQPVAERLVAAEPPQSQHWHLVLARLSRMRELAWRRGQPQLLRRIYVPAAPELKRDQAMLRRYTARGLSVRGAELLFGPVRVVDRAPRVVRLRTVDQLRAAVAVSRHGDRLRLPLDRPTRHLITLCQTPEGWRITSVTDTAW